MNNLKSISGIFQTLNGAIPKTIYFDDKQGLILNIEEKINVQADYYYGLDCLIFPGMGDVHIHAREDISFKNCYKEDFTSASLAALNGGIVHVGDMPNNPVPPIDDESYKNKVQLTANKEIPFLMYAGIGPNTFPLSYKVPYKAFMGPSIGDLFFENNQVLDDTISRYQNQFVSFHCEDPDILNDSKNNSDHFTKRPVKAEILATEFALYLIKKYQLKGKLCHYSSGDGLDAILNFRKEGGNVLIEVTPQHLFFSEEKISSEYQAEKTFFQMNPPIRGERDRQKLLTALKKGEIDILATDHAPHSKEEKEKGMSGMPGLDTYGLFVCWLINEVKVDPAIILKMTSINPGNFFNEFLPELQNKFPHYQKFGKGFGHLLTGYSASFTVLNLKAKTKFLNNHLKSKAHWSPFHQVEFKGKVEAVFINGALKN